MDGNLKVAFSWRSRVRDWMRNNHYTELDDWRPLFALEGVSFISMQYGDDWRPEIDPWLGSTVAPIHCFDDTDMTNDFEAIFALAVAVDLVICPSSTLAWAGASVGTPTWMFHLKPFYPAYGLERVPGYPALSMFGKQVTEPWSGVFKSLAGALQGKDRSAGGAILMEEMSTLSMLDYLAVTAFLASWFTYEWVGSWPMMRQKNLSYIMRGWRKDWFDTACSRDNRIIDVQILRSLAGNSAFLATTTIFVIGGLAALIGASEHAVRVLNGFQYLPETNQNRFGLKIAVLLGIFIYAFFRLAWSIRLHNNAAVVSAPFRSPTRRWTGTSSSARRASRPTDLARSQTLQRRHALLLLRHGGVRLVHPPRSPWSRQPSGSSRSCTARSTAPTPTRPCRSRRGARANLAYLNHFVPR